MTSLVMHPPIHQHESLPSYITRLAEQNGYSSTRDLFRLAAMSGSEISIPTIACEKLARITRQSVSDLERNAFSKLGSESPGLLLLGNAVGKSYIDLVKAKLCPDCVVSKGFIEAHWHLDYMVACPTHRQAAVWYCPRCRKRLTWLRPGLLVCRCKAPVQAPSKIEFSDAEFRLLDLIRCKALRETSIDNSEESFERWLGNWSLTDILSLTRVLGISQLKGEARKQNRLVVRAAARVLDSWEATFPILLNSIFTDERYKPSWPQNLEDVYEAISERWRLFNSASVDVAPMQPRRFTIEQLKLILEERNAAPK